MSKTDINWAEESNVIPKTGKTGPVLGICTPTAGIHKMEGSGEKPGPSGMKRRGATSGKSFNKKGKAYSADLD